jgi:hypothetical protein
MEKAHVSSPPMTKESVFRLLRRTIVALSVYYCFHAVPLEIRASRRFWDVARWPVTEAVVRSANVSVTSYPWSSKSDRFCPDVQYSYTVSGQSYTNRNQVFDFSCWPDAYSFVAKYQPGNAIQIAYDPSNPNNTIVPSSVSDPGYPWGDMLGGMFFLVLLFADILFTRRESER